MNDSDKKRRLPIVTSDPPQGEPPATSAPSATPDAKRLMTEVLPDPTRKEGAGSARQRTLERMAKLMAIAVASSAIGARCGPHAGVATPDATAPQFQGGYAVVDALPPPQVIEDVPAVPETADATAQRGYIAVDPLPPPRVRDQNQRGRNRRR